MRVLPYNNTQRIIIDPGEFYVSRRREIISTLLGSCVAACLYDPVKGVIGMNHFLLAYRHHAYNTPVLESDEGRYGVYAMELLINEMMKQGANRKNLQAKCFGGGNVLNLREDKDNRQTVGEVNVQFIREFLKNENIPVFGSCLGGKHGRTVHFLGSDYSVYVRRIDKKLETALQQEERRYWKKNLDEHENVKSTVEIW